MKDPTTRGEWLEAALLAQVHLHIDAAQSYGLVAGGPDVDVARCEELLARARDEHGIVPTEAEIEALIPGVLAEMVA